MRQRTKTLLLCADIVQVEWSDDRGVPRRSPAILEEIQPSGALLLLDTDCPPHKANAVRLSPCGYRGKARRSTESPSGYHIEIAFDKGVRWHPADYQPTHSFNPNSRPTPPAAPGPHH